MPLHTNTASLGGCVDVRVAQAGREHESDLCPLLVRGWGLSPSPVCTQCGLRVHNPAQGGGRAGHAAWRVVSVCVR